MRPSVMSHKNVAKVVWYILGQQLSSLSEKITSTN